MVLKQDGVHFVLCPKQGNKIEGVALNRVCILGFFFVLNRLRVPNPTQILVSTSTLPPSLVMSIRHSQALLWQTVDFQPVFQLLSHFQISGGDGRSQVSF